MERIETDPVLSEAFSEGKMLGVLVCERSGTGNSQNDSFHRSHETSDTSPRNICYISAFSGSIRGMSTIEGFVPPIYDLTIPDGEFRRREAEISELNHRIEAALTSEKAVSLRAALKEAERARDEETRLMKAAMAHSKRERSKTRMECSDQDILHELTRQSQHEKAQLRRLKLSWEERIAEIRTLLEDYLTDIETLKRRRAAMSEKLQDWIFRQYIVHNSLGEASSIADIFTSSGLVPPGGTGECAAPKLLEYAFRNGLVPLAMGEFWFGKNSETAVRSHGGFYPSCTSKCGPLLGYMMQGLTSCESGSTSMGMTPALIYEDEVVIVVEKPSRMPSVPGLDGRKSLLEWLTEMAEASVHQIHRLDMDTSGVMVFTKTAEAALSLRKQFEEHTIRKTYMARVGTTGNFSGGSGHLSLPLSLDYDERPRQKVDFKQGKPAHTEYKTVTIHTDGTADLLLYPHTGRTHQLRVHCAHALGLNSPIIGDLLYGAHNVYMAEHPSRLCLHALSLTFTHPLTGEKLTFTSDRLCYR